MILLDTNVVSESMKPDGDARVFAWLSAQDPSRLCLAATSLAELLLGLQLLPDGARKRGRIAALEQVVGAFFAHRVIPFDAIAAAAYAHVVARARASGRQIAMADGQIAAIASVHRCSVATRDLSPFEAAGVPVIDPWRGAGAAR